MWQPQRARAPYPQHELSKAQATEKKEATVVQQDKGYSKGHNTSIAHEHFYLTLWDGALGCAVEIGGQTF